MPAVNLAELRVNRGLSVRAAALEMGVSHKTLLVAEQGKHVPQPANAFKIAGFYGLKVTDVWPIADVAA